MAMAYSPRVPYRSDHAGQLESGQRVHLKSDVYSFGIVLWELLTFDAPYYIVPMDHKEPLQQQYQQHQRVRAQNRDLVTRTVNPDAPIPQLNQPLLSADKKKRRHHDNDYIHAAATQQNPRRKVEYKLKTGRSHKKAVKYVLGLGLRPPVPYDAPEGLQLLLCDCWLAIPSQRPSFSEILRRLEPFLDLHRPSTTIHASTAYTRTSMYTSVGSSGSDGYEDKYLLFPFNARNDNRTDIQALIRNAADPNIIREQMQHQPHSRSSSGV
jgi:serine/threonine protein kinase